MRKIGILDLSLIKLLQNEQACNFFASVYIYNMLSKSSVTSSTIYWFPVCADRLLRKRQYILFIYCEDEWFVLPEHAIAEKSFASHLFNILPFPSRLTVLTKRLHCRRLRRQTSSDRSTGHQTAWISIRLTTRSGAFCKSECTVPLPDP